MKYPRNIHLFWVVYDVTYHFVNRFGIPDEDAKKKARIERFSKSLVEDPEEMEKRKARAAR
jgi:hypothetical protein